MPQDFHPTSSASDGKPFQQTKLRAPGEPSETNIWKCGHCGMRNDRTEVPLPSPQGDSKQYISINVPIPGGVRVFYDPTVTGGCSFCGLNYTQSSYRKKFFSSTNLQGR